MFIDEYFIDKLHQAQLKEKEYKFVLQERDIGKYHYEIKLVLVGIYEQDLITVIEYVNSLTVAQMKALLKHQMDYILLDFILWDHLYRK